MYVSMYVCMYVCKYVSMYVCMYVCMCTNADYIDVWYTCVQPPQSSAIFNRCVLTILLNARLQRELDAPNLWTILEEFYPACDDVRDTHRT